MSGLGREETLQIVRMELDRAFDWSRRLDALAARVERLEQAPKIAQGPFDPGRFTGTRPLGCGPVDMGEHRG